MATFKDSEDSIVDRLAPLLAAEINIIVMPDKQGELDKPSIDKPRIVVSFGNSRAEKGGDLKPKQNTLSAGTQIEICEFVITLQSSRRRSEKGIYNLRRLVMLLLIGFRPTLCDKLYFVDFKPTKYEDNVWTYELYLGCESRIIEDVDTEEIIAAAILLMKADDLTGTNEQVVVASE